MIARIRCRAVFLDAGGVIVLPDRHLLTDALARAGIRIDATAVPRAHYRAVRTLDRATGTPSAPTRADYPRALLPQLGIAPGRTADAIAIWEQLADRRPAPQVLWSEATPAAHQTIDALRHAGIAVVIVTNSDGHAEENLAQCGFADLRVIDSEIVGVRKPDPRIFEAALSCAGVRGADAVHVGDTLANDVAGAHAAGITPIHFDPLRACRATDHLHMRTLAGIWRHIGRSRTAPDRASAPS